MASAVAFMMMEIFTVRKKVRFREGRTHTGRGSRQTIYWFPASLVGVVFFWRDYSVSGFLCEPA